MKIKELHLYTNDLAATMDFYGGLMQFHINNENNHSFNFTAGESIVFFHEIKNEKPVYHFAFHIPNNKLQEALNWVSERTQVLPFSEESLVAEFTNWNAKSFYFHDNNKNILEFITHFDRQIETTNPFSTDCINQLIEIGIPAKDVLGTCKKIQADYEIDFFIKGPVTENFSVMGDENGMLIITKEDSTWLPTEQRTEKFNMKVLLENNLKTFILELTK